MTVVFSIDLFNLKKSKIIATPNSCLYKRGRVGLSFEISPKKEGVKISK